MRTTGKAYLTGGELVDVVRWIRPYGAPYGVLSDGREVHADELHRTEADAKWAAQ